MITASAPGKLLLFGEHAVVYGHPCMVTAVNQRVYVSVEKNGEDVLYMEAPDLGMMAYSKTIDELGTKDVPKGVAFVEMLYKRFLEQYPQDRGVVVKTRSDFSSTFGFGSSSAVTVAFAKALIELYGLALDNQELFKICYRAVLDVQGVGSGFDLAAAIWGGTIYYVPPARVVEGVDLDGMKLVVGYTGVKADTATLVRRVGEMRGKEPKKIDEVMNRIEELVEESRKAIADRNWQKTGDLMKQNQELLRSLEVSSGELEKLIGTAEKAGAFGAKLSGAGGGDCMVAIVGDDKLNEVEVAIAQAGGEVMRVELNAEGVRYES